MTRPSTLANVNTFPNELSNIAIEIEILLAVFVWDIARCDSPQSFDREQSTVVATKFLEGIYYFNGLHGVEEANANSEK